MSKLMAASIIVVLWIAVVVAGDASPARTVNLNKPGVLETLQQSNPTHYEKVRVFLFPLVFGTQRKRSRN